MSLNISCKVVMIVPMFQYVYCGILNVSLLVSIALRLLWPLSFM